MNYLALVQRLARESGATGSASQITTAQSPVGETQRLCDWIVAAWDELQSRHQNWRWMRSRFSGPTVVGTDTYAYNAAGWTDSRLSAAISRFARWIPFDDVGASNMSRYLTATGVSVEIWMTHIPWAYFQALYRFGTQNNGPIIHASIDPQNKLVVGPKPDAVYTIRGEYQMSNQSLSADADIPEMPTQFHMLIVYLAMEKYGYYYSAPEVIGRAQREGARLMRMLEADQLPAIALGAPLA